MLYPFVGTDGEMHWYSGTAEAVYHNLGFIRSRRIDEVLILSGDHIYTMRYEEMMELHHQQRADITVGVTEVPWSEANRFGTLSLDNINRVTAFEEKPSQPKSSWKKDPKISFGLLLRVCCRKTDWGENCLKN